jgi:hypothetical protein
VLAELDNASFQIFRAASDEVLRYLEDFQFPQFARSPDMARVEAVLKAEGSQQRQKRRQSITMDATGLGDARSLRQILQHQTATRFFKDFCMRTFVNESLLFWLDADHYSNLPSSDYMRRTAYKICRKYVFDRARMQINISHDTRVDVLRNLADPQRFLFRRAQDEIFRLLEQDAVPKFVAGPEYRALLLAMAEGSGGVGAAGAGLGAGLGAGAGAGLGLGLGTGVGAGGAGAGLAGPGGAVGSADGAGASTRSSGYGSSRQPAATLSKALTSAFGGR